MGNQKAPLTLNQEQRRLLGMMGWEHGKPLNDNVRGLLGWHFGTKGETKDAQGRVFGQLIAGKSVFMIHPRVMAQWIMFYIDNKVKHDDLLAVTVQYGIAPRIEPRKTFTGIPSAQPAPKQVQA